MDLLKGFYMKVQQFPNTTFIYTNKKNYSYKEINEKSDILSNYILNNCKNDYIGINLENKTFIIIAILAILKANKTYIPIDRENKIKEKIILSENFIDFILDEETIIAVLNSSIKKRNDNGFIYNLEKNAYILYTSGSTSLPKAVPITYNNIINKIRVIASDFEFDKESCSLFFSNYAFDMSILQLFPIFYSGGQVCIIDKEDIIKIFDYIKNINITHLIVTPGILEKNIIYKKNNIYLNKLKYLLVGGDIFSINLFKLLMNNGFENINIYNIYGPTESVICCTKYLITKDEKDFIPIGRSFNDCNIKLIDKNKKIIDKKNKIGEICVEGNIFKGYLNNIKNKLDFYCTGDFAFYDESNNLIFIGRKDGQIKLNGKRINLYEVQLEYENILKKMDIFKNFKFIKIDFINKKLIMKYSLYDGKYIDYKIKKEILSNVENNIVNKFINIETEINSNGKITENNRITKDIQSDLLNIWKKILESEDIDGDFWNDGGDSLSLIMLFSEIEEKYKLSIDREEFIKNPTLIFLNDKIKFSLQEKEKKGEFQKLNYHKYSKDIIKEYQDKFYNKVMNSNTIDKLQTNHLLLKNDFSNKLLEFMIDLTNYNQSDVEKFFNSQDIFKICYSINGSYIDFLKKDIYYKFSDFYQIQLSSMNEIKEIRENLKSLLHINKIPFIPIIIEIDRKMYLYLLVIDNIIDFYSKELIQNIKPDNSKGYWNYLKEIYQNKKKLDTLIQYLSTNLNNVQIKNKKRRIKSYNIKYSTERIDEILKIILLELEINSADIRLFYNDRILKEKYLNTIGSMVNSILYKISNKGIDKSIHNYIIQNNLNTQILKDNKNCINYFSKTISLNFLGVCKDSYEYKKIIENPLKNTSLYYPILAFNYKEDLIIIYNDKEVNV